MNQSPLLSTAVESSVLASVAYGRDTVPPTVFRALLSAQSKGAYFNRSIRNRFRYQRLA